MLVNGFVTDTHGKLLEKSASLNQILRLQCDRQQDTDRSSSVMS